MITQIWIESEEVAQARQSYLEEKEFMEKIVIIIGFLAFFAVVLQTVGVLCG